MLAALLPAALAALSCTPSQAHVARPERTREARAALEAVPPLEAFEISMAGSVASGARTDEHEATTDEHAHEHGDREPELTEDDAPELDVLPVLSREQIAALVGTDLSALGSMSLGKPNAGALINGVQMPPGERWELVSAQRAWATQETIDYLITAIDKVHAEFPGAHKLSIGHFSKEKGGRIHPHRSHQSGRDIDIGYFYVPEKAEWYRPATSQTLDLQRSWALVKSFVVDTDVEMIFIDRSVQRLLKEYALSVGEDPSWLNTIFQYKSRNPEPIVRHTWGHKTHIHVRFYNPKAQQLGVEAYDALVAKKIITPRNYLLPYKARGADTLAGLAKKAGTSEATIQRVNGIGAISPGQVLFVPMRGQVALVEQVVVPPRRLPPPQTGGKRIVAAASE